MRSSVHLAISIPAAVLALLLGPDPAWSRVPLQRGAGAPASAPAVGAPLVATTSVDGAGRTAKISQRLAAPLGCERLTLAEGLPNSNVRAIVQDARGFLWFGTQDGLARYDGLRMRVYRPVDKDPTSISSGYITSLATDAQGKLWVGTPEHGVSVYDPDTDRFTRFVRGPGGAELTSEGVTSIARDERGRMWLAMSGSGLHRFEPAGDAGGAGFTKFLAKPLDVAITAMDVDAAGTLWLGTATGELLQWAPDRPATAARAIPADREGAAPITSVLAAEGGTVWVGSDGDGAWSFDPKTGKATRYRSVATDLGTLSDDHVSSLFQDASKQIWIGTTNGLNRVETTGRLTRFMHDSTNPTTLSFHGVESIYQDAGGVMWIGGFTVGVCKFDELRLRLGHYHTGNLTTAFFEDSDGTLWVGTYNDGLYKYERAAQRLTSYRELHRSQSGESAPITLESGSWISALHRDRRGTLWIALRGHGLVAFDTKTETHRYYTPDPDNPRSLPSDSVLYIWEDADGKLWLATWGAGLVRFDPQLDVFTAYGADASDAAGMSSNHLYTIHPDPVDQKVLWIGAGKGGLIRFHTVSGTAKSFRHRPEDPTTISSDDVTTVVREPGGGHLWIGTYGGGVSRVHPETGRAERFTTANSGLPNNVILGLLLDDEGRPWLSTNGGGLVRMDPKTRELVVYNASDGVQDNEFNQGSFMRARSGEMFFGGPRGFNAFFPRDLKRDLYVPPVALTAFKVFNQELTLERPIWTLPTVQVSYSDSFEVQFAAMAFGAPAKNRYAYKLEGFDDEYIETDRPYATYTKLAGGKYTLRVRATNRHGVTNEAGVALQIIATPPFWRTWRAYILYMGLLAAAAFLLIRYQRQRLQRAEREGRLAVVERDLELTGAVQTGFLPEHNEIVAPPVQLFGFYRPADACGGDWWWHEVLSGGRRVVMVGDVTGHGPGPAMVTAAVATAFRVLLENGLDDVQHALHMLNREVLRVAKGKYHMTMAALELEEATGRWILYSAGAPPMLSLGASGRHRVHFCAGAPLGTEVGFEAGRVEGALEPGERLLMYTDGIPELELPNGTVFGMRRFAQLYEHTRGQDLREAATMILSHAHQSIGGKPQLDDWTFALIQWDGIPGPGSGPGYGYPAG
jgi:ligand-binding sensor domain-containing protein/serine phosphatase RsbU (regulator of sigma subunit)